MEKSKDFYSVPNRIDHISLKTIYEVGRNTSDNYYEGFDENISHEKRRLLLKVISPLYDFLISGQAKFYPLFIEFALFDPTNISGNKFYSILTSPKKDLFNDYLTEMRNNVHYQGNGKERGPLIPNEGLYKYTFYRLSQETKTNFKEHTAEDLIIKFGCFNVKSEKNDKGEKVETFVKSFLEKTFSNFESNDSLKNVEESKSTRKLNQAMLIPLFRPAAPVDPNVERHEEIFRGGGIFLYGSIEKGFNEHLFVLEMRAFLMKSILEASHNEIEIERMKALQADLELHLYHHFGSNLRNLPDLFSLKNFGGENLNDFQKGIINTIQNYVKGHIDNTRAVLGAYQQYLDNDGVSPHHDIESLKEMFYDLRQEVQDQNNFWKIPSENIKLSTEGLKGDENIALSPKIFRNFIEQFIHNASKEYDEIDLEIEKRVITISIIGEEHLVTFKFYNEGTEMDSFVINRAGKKPIKSTNSSGLGYYFFNFSLKLCGAEKVDDKYFKIENSLSPKGVLLTFSFSNLTL